MDIYIRLPYYLGLKVEYISYNQQQWFSKLGSDFLCGVNGIMMKKFFPTTRSTTYVTYKRLHLTLYKYGYKEGCTETAHDML